MDKNDSERCRLCYHLNKQTINIFDKNGIDLNIATIISTHFWFKVDEYDNLSNVICTECWRSTNNFHRFYNDIEYVHKNVQPTFDVHLKIEKHNKCDDTTIPIDNIDNTSNILEDSVVNSIENKSMPHHTEVVTMPYYKYKNIKIIGSNLYEDGLKNDLNVELHPIDDAEENPFIEVAEILLDDINCINDFETTTASSITTGGENPKLQRQTEDEQIRNYFQMDCEICNIKLLTFSEVRIHYRNEHNTNGYITCCSRRFIQRGQIVNHLNTHLNPDDYKCKYCNKIFTKKSSLTYHLVTHDNSLEKPYKCELCTKSFLKFFQLTNHCNLQHSKIQFTCDVCGKSYKSKYHIALHIKNVHASQRNLMCDICAKVYKTNHTLKCHRMSHFHTEEKPKVQCNVCGIWLKANEQYFRKHLRRHKDFARICPKCGKEAPNREALLNHIRYVHSDAKLFCTICNKGFKHAVTLKEHMASHTGEKLYTCTHCPKTFNSNANMYSHRKKIHPIEWERMREKRSNP